MSDLTANEKLNSLENLFMVDDAWIAETLEITERSIRNYKIGNGNFDIFVLVADFILGMKPFNIKEVKSLLEIEYTNKQKIVIMSKLIDLIDKKNNFTKGALKDRAARNTLLKKNHTTITRMYKNENVKMIYILYLGTLLDLDIMAFLKKINKISKGDFI